MYPAAAVVSPGAEGVQHGAVNGGPAPLTTSCFYPPIKGLPGQIVAAFPKHRALKETKMDTS